MTVHAARVSVTNTATRIDGSADADYSPGEQCMVRNRDTTNSVFLGGSDVTAAAGFEVLPGEAVPISLVAGDTLWGITASATVVCHVIQSGT
jgi:hypothetical protein